MNVRTFKSWGCLLVITLAAAFLSACQTGGSAADSEMNAMARAAAATNANAAASLEGDPEILKPGDYLKIIYTDLPTVTPAFEGQIRPDGTVTLLLNKEFKASGLTRPQLEKEIRKAYVPDYFKTMTLTILPREEMRLYYVGGAVRSPGPKMYMVGMTLTKAIQSAGDFNEFANRKKVRLTRGGTQKVETINAAKALRDPKLDPEVYPGDRIYVPQRIL